MTSDLPAIKEAILPNSEVRNSGSIPRSVYTRPAQSRASVRVSFEILGSESLCLLLASCGRRGAPVRRRSLSVSVKPISGRTFGLHFGPAGPRLYCGRVPSSPNGIRRKVLSPLSVSRDRPGLKILETATLGKTIVSMGIGAEGLEFVDGKEIVLADEPSEFADAVGSLLTDGGRRSRLAQAARKRLEKNYSFPVMRAAVRDIWNFLDGRNSGRERLPVFGHSGSAELSPDSQISGI